MRGGRNTDSEQETIARPRIPHLDILRLLGALGVVFFHYAFAGYATGRSGLSYPLLVLPAKYGYLGVDLLFLISGFVITMSASSGSLKKFVAARIARLYPVFWVCCTATFLIAFSSGDTPPVSSGQYLANMTLAADFLRIPLIDSAYWALSVEIVFYVFVSLVLAFRMIRKTELLLLLWLLATIALDAWQVPFLRRLLLANYSPYFIAGGFFYFVYTRGLSVTRACVILVTWGVALLHAIERLEYLRQTYNARFDDLVAAVIVSAFFVAMALLAMKRVKGTGGKKWLAIGAMTYPLYLLHHRLGYIIFNAGYPVVNPHILLFATVAAMLASAMLVHVIVEQRVSPRMKLWLEDVLGSRVPSLK